MAAGRPRQSTSPANAQDPALRMVDLDVLKSDATDLSECVVMIYVGVGGDVSLTDSEGHTLLHRNAASGTYLGPFQVARVRSSGTTATGLVGYV